MDKIICTCGMSLYYCASGVVRDGVIIPDPRKSAWKVLHRPHLAGKFKIVYSVEGGDDEDNLVDGDAHREDCEGVGMADDSYDMGYA